MKKIKLFIAIVLCAIFTTAFLTSLTGCDAKYRPVNFRAEDGYSVNFEQGNNTFLIKKSDGTVIGELNPSGWFSVNEKGEHGYSGIGKEQKDIEIKLLLKPEYDPETVTVTVNGNNSTHVGTSPYIQSKINGEELVEEYFTSIKYIYEISRGEKSFDVNIGGIKVLTIGGHKWRLHGIKDGEIFSIYGDTYENLTVGTELNCSFDFKEDGSAIVTLKNGDETISENGTWTEESGILNATFEEKFGAIRLTIMTAEQRKEFITDKEKVANVPEEKRALGIGLLWDNGVAQLIMVLDIIE